MDNTSPIPPIVQKLSLLQVVTSLGARVFCAAVSRPLSNNMGFLPIHLPTQSQRGLSYSINKQSNRNHLWVKFILCVLQIFSLAHLPLTKREREEFITYTTPHQQAVNNMFWLHCLGALMSAIFIYCQQFGSFD